MAKRRVRLKEVKALVEDSSTVEEEAEEDPTESIPLFAGGDNGDAIVGIQISRLEPVAEGVLPGPLPPDADEEMIRRKWGGGTYRIYARGADSRIKAQRTITISGDPLFESVDSLRKWNIKTGKLEPPAETKAPQATPGMGLPELFAIINQGHQQQLELLRIQMAASKVEADERERRARQDADDRESRARREAEESRERDRQFHATMLAMKGDKSSDPSALVNVMLKGLELGRGFSGGDGKPTDAVTAMLSNLPQTLDAIGGLAAQARGAGPAPALAAPPGAPVKQRLVITGQVADRLHSEVRQLMAKGYAPEDAKAAAEAAILGGLSALANIPPAPGSTIAHTPPPEPQPAPEPAREPDQEEEEDEERPPPQDIPRKATRSRSRATPRR